MTDLRAWEVIQAEYADIHGEQGISARAEAYAPYFLRFGRGVRIEEGCRFSHPERIVLDDDTRINRGAYIYGSGGVHLGRHSRIGPRAFIHSANHDVAASAQAYFEKGYVYERVVVGDNCLISANVSLLPGARLGTGCFAACGAVVKRGEYAENSFLAGMPAQPRPQPAATWKEAPSMAILATRDSDEYAGARLLISSLGLPQVRIFAPEDLLPDSVRAVLDFTGNASGAHGRVWRLAATENVLQGDAELTHPYREQAYSLRSARNHTVYPAVSSESSMLRAAVFTLRAVLKRAEKGAMGDPDSMRVLRCALTERPSPYLAEYAQRIHDVTVDNPAESFAELARITLRGEYAGSPFKRYLLTALTSPGTPVGATAAAAICKRYFLQAHDIVFALCLRSRRTLRRVWKERCVRLLDTPVPPVLALYGIAALHHGEDSIAEQIANRLVQPDLYDPETSLIRNRSGAASFCYSPALASFLILAAQHDLDAMSSQVCLSRVKNRTWQVFHDENPAWAVATGSGIGGFVHPGDQLVSRSLLDNWMDALTVPDIGDGSYELSDDSYAPDALVLEQCWLAVFRTMAEQADVTLARVLPWPAGYDAALSLTFDVDRKTPVEQGKALMDIQCGAYNAACASWYRIPGADHSHPLKEFVRNHLQETGVHALGTQNEISCLGVTFHSGLRSDYWEGLKSVQWLEREQALYGEMMSSQTGFPRPVLVREGGRRRMSRVWLLPIRFPLEGSTSDTTLDYFDRLGEQFDELLHSGGHGVICTHPDLTHRLLERLAERLDMQGLWRVPAEKAVARCRSLLEYGAISAAAGEDGAVVLAGRHSVADVHVELYGPDGGAPRSHTLQLVSGFPRKVA